MGRTLIQKLWDAHTVADLGDDATLLYMDRVFLHERTGSVSLKGLEAAGRKVRNPEQVFCTMDHIVDTLPGRGDETIMPSGKDFITTTRDAANAAGITLFDIGDDRQGIVHVVSAEQGITLPGLTQVCPDSHTCTLGALGALAWGIGSTEGEHALATKTLAVNKPKSMRVSFDGTLGFGVTAKDMILHLIGEYTASGGVGHAIEFAGSAIKALSVEGRMTLCNMAIEAGARAGMIAVDQTTIDYLRGRPFAPDGDLWDEAVTYWRTLTSDSGAIFDSVVTLDGVDLNPQVTWGTSPEMVLDIDGRIPDPDEEKDASKKESIEQALEYMGLKPNTRLKDIKIDKVFIGSCTNSRIEDMRIAANVVKGRRVASNVQLAMVVPGSGLVKAQAEKEGLDKIFMAAGFEWRQPGCSMCLAMNNDRLEAGERCASTSNRNFEGRQGAGGRTHLLSPAMAASAAISGTFSDVRNLVAN